MGIAALGPDGLESGPPTRQVDVNGDGLCHHPTAEFVAHTAKRIETCTDGTPNHLLRGRFTLRGITREIQFPILAATADGQRIAFVTWVWPQLKGVKAQADKLKEVQAVKDSAFATEDAVYRHWDHNLPMNRVPHLCVMEVATGRVHDLLEGTDFELQRREPGAHDFAIAPNGKSISFVHDPDRGQNPAPRMALAQIELHIKNDIAPRM